MRRSFTVLAAVSLLVGLLVSPTSATVPTGTWEQYPVGSTEYHADVQQPIDSANTSNWNSKSKGAIPVMFKLSSRTGPAAFESIGSDANIDNDYAYLSFAPDLATTFGAIGNLSAIYAWDIGDCWGGSLRWQVRVDSNGNGLNDPKTDAHPSGDAAVFIYYGVYPSFGNDGVSGCGGDELVGVDQSGQNMIGDPDLRYDITQFGTGAGFPFYGSYAQAVAVTGSARVWRASLVLDSGWRGDQRLLPGTVASVDGNSRMFISSTGSAFAPTCTLPPATIKITKTFGVDQGVVDETATTYQPDGGVNFRVVDCKYQYNLSIPSLKGSGHYFIEIQIGGNTIGTANFDLM
jgi:hypothetical protein